MKDINIAGTLVAKRSEKGITQEELASFIGVSKASVSKWEKGHSYPDITFLPQLASYFGISMDELMGYEQQMTADDIRKLNIELLEAFAEKPFDETMNRCRDIIKKYFSCFPLLFQIGTLFANYGTAVKDDEQKTAILAEAQELFVRVKTFSDSAELRELALHGEAACEMLLDNAAKVIELLEDESRYAVQPSVNVMLSQSYKTLGKMREAQAIMQASILESVVSFFFEIPYYIKVCADAEHFTEHFEEICRRTTGMIELFNAKKLCPIAILPFYFAAAEEYMAIGSPEKALEMLETCVEVAAGDIFPLTVKGDEFFTLIDESHDELLSEQPFGMPEIPRDEQSLRREMADGIINNPAFSDLHENHQFKALAVKLEQVL